MSDDLPATTDQHGEPVTVSVFDQTEEKTFRGYFGSHPVAPGDAIVFTVHRCAYLDGSCGQSPCVVPEDRETRPQWANLHDSSCNGRVCLNPDHEPPVEPRHECDVCPACKNCHECELPGPVCDPSAFVYVEHP